MGLVSMAVPIAVRRIPVPVAVAKPGRRLPYDDRAGIGVAAKVTVRHHWWRRLHTHQWPIVRTLVAPDNRPLRGVPVFRMHLGCQRSHSAGQ